MLRRYAEIVAPNTPISRGMSQWVIEPLSLNVLPDADGARPGRRFLRTRSMRSPGYAPSASP